MIVDQTVRVTAIRSQNPKGFGGCIFTAKPIGADGLADDATRYYAVVASASVLSGLVVERGQWLQVSGESSTRSLEVNGFEISEIQVEATSTVQVRPSGEHLVTFMAENPAFAGIGQVKARKLWSAFGERLYHLLDRGDTSALAKVLTPESAAQVVDAWARVGNSRTLQWLQSQGFDIAIGRKLLQFFGAETAEKLEEDPYRLLSFCASWRQTDSLARQHFGVALDDPRRLQGAIEEACYRIFTAGHTTALSSRLEDYLRGVLGSQTKALRWRQLIPQAIEQGHASGCFVVGPHGLQPLAAMVMERQVAQAVVERVVATAEPLMPDEALEQLLLAYEKTEGIELNTPQRQAIQLAAAKRIALITGGAGVGKTTVLKVLYELYDRVGVQVVQVALAGRAAKRMQEATGRPALTLASFLRTWKSDDANDRCAIVVDEASMVDIITMSRLCSLIGSLPRLVLVGDTAQLMPVGPGLVLHALAQVPEVPVARLTVVKRYGGDIAAAAAQVREGRWPAMSSDPAQPIAFLPCTDELIPQKVLELYRQEPLSTQILCGRRGGPDGTKSINALCQVELSNGALPMLVWDDQHGAYARVGINLGDPVLCTRNLWDRGLQNGSLGVVTEIISEPGPYTSAEGEETAKTLAWADWDDGVRRPITPEMLDDIELGYAITVHKAQGSQWPRIVVPLTGHRLLDRTLVYTAITRAQRQVLLVGDEVAAKAAVRALPRAQTREVALDLTLANMLSSPHPQPASD